jgi:hypothetical protein
MVKNYSQNKSLYLKVSPSKMVINRILAFSRAYRVNKKLKKHLSIIKN